MERYLHIITASPEYTDDCYTYITSNLFSPNEHRDVCLAMHTYRVLKVMLPFGTLISFGFLCFYFAFRQGTQTENPDGSHNCFFFFSVKRVPV